jgi:hypothetical protein
MDKPTTFVCFLFAPRPGMPAWSSVYTPEWVDKLYRGIKRNTSDPFPHVVCFTDKEYAFKETVFQVRLNNPDAGFGCLAEAWRDDYTERRICVLGLDTVIVKNIDTIIDTDCEVGLLRDPYAKTTVGNMVGIYSREACEQLDMKWALYGKGQTEQNFLRKCVGESCMEGKDGCVLLNDMYPGQILSYKVDLRNGQWGGAEGDKDKARIIYFHGNPKMNEINSPWLEENWI